MPLLVQYRIREPTGPQSIPAKLPVQESLEEIVARFVDGVPDRTWNARSLECLCSAFVQDQSLAVPDNYVDRNLAWINGVGVDGRYKIVKCLDWLSDDLDAVINRPCTLWGDALRLNNHNSILVLRSVTIKIDKT